MTLVSVGPVTTWSPSARKKRCASLSASKARGVETEGSCALEAVRCYDRASDLLGAVDAVGVAGDGEDLGPAVEFNHERQQELDVPAAAARSLTVTVVSPPEMSTHGGGAGWPCTAT